MSAVWVVPVLALVIGGAAVASLLRVVAGDARELAREVARFGEMHHDVAGLRAELVRARTTASTLRRP
jgi:hypothetical protein